MSLLQTTPGTSIAFDWRSSNSQLQEMHAYKYEIPHRFRPVVVNGKVYVKGGSPRMDYLFEYTPETDYCEPLGLSQFRKCGDTLATLEERLVLITGYCDVEMDGTSEEDPIKVWAWNTDSQSWDDPYPECYSFRSSPAAIEHCNSLILAGGYITNCFGYNHKRDVVVLRDNEYWSFETSLPAVDHYNPVIIEDTLYLIGCEKGTVLRTHLSTRSLVWERLADVPVPNHSSIVANGDTILTFGDGTVHFFNSHMNQWTKIGDFLTDCFSCTLLPSGELLAIGGNYAKIAKFNLQLSQ